LGGGERVKRMLLLLLGIFYVGVMYPFSEHFALDLSYRYAQFDEGETQNGIFGALHFVVKLKILMFSEDSCFAVYILAVFLKQIEKLSF